MKMLQIKNITYLNITNKKILLIEKVLHLKAAI